jgi:hypothetical protein
MHCVVPGGTLGSGGWSSAHTQGSAPPPRSWQKQPQSQPVITLIIVFENRLKNRKVSTWTVSQPTVAKPESSKAAASNLPTARLGLRFLVCTGKGSLLCTDMSFPSLITMVAMVQHPPKHEASCRAVFTAVGLLPLSHSAEHSCGRLQFGVLRMHSMICAQPEVLLH